MFSKTYGRWILILTLLLLVTECYCQVVTDFSYINNFKNKRVDYPVRFTYVNNITIWWPPSSTLAQMAVPTYAEPHSYNYVALTFWTCQAGPIDTSKLWDDPIKYFGQQLGSTKLQVQQFLKNKYNQAGVSIILSAFGAAQYPTTLGLDPTQCAQKLGDYVNKNNYDGVDIDYEDNQAMNKGQGQQWLITFMTQLRKVIPYHLISHAPQGPYFGSNYIGGGYRKIHKQVGNLIDFYNVQFYNQLNATYDTYDLLFKNSGFASPQTSISQLNTFGGVPYNMLVLGKPGSRYDVHNTGYVKAIDLYQYIVRGSRELGWNTGVMFWQYSSDWNGTISNQLAKLMKALNIK